MDDTYPASLDDLAGLADLARGDQVTGDAPKRIMADEPEPPDDPTSSGDGWIPL